MNAFLSPCVVSLVSFRRHSVAAFFALLQMCVGSSTTGAESQKNIALIITDNQNWFDLGCYGNTVIKTPNMDQLAREGVRFRQAFATVASCGPSRAVIYSGILTHRNGQYAHPPLEHNQQLREDITTVFSRLKDRGYRTAIIGKKHIKPEEKYPLDFWPGISSNDNPTGTKDVLGLAEAADTFIGAESNQPFFLTFSLGDPHPNSLDGVAWGMREKDSPGYRPVDYDIESIEVPGFLPDTREVREQLAGYYQQVSRADHGIGLLIDSLKKHGKYEDTLIIFISDHGTSEPGAMGTQYDPGVRAPFIIRKPNGPTGLVHEALIAFTDITPTLLDWAGVADPNKGLHGRTILPILDQPDVAGWDEVLLSHIAHEIYSYYPMRTLRGRRYKLIWNVTWQAEYPVPVDTFSRRLWKGIFETKATMIGPRTVDQFLHRPKFELYDLEKDPWEVRNLADDPAHGELKKQMTARLLERLVATEDPWLKKYHPDW
jgi:N-sulfoglucosamine sulfohydrolase